ncbi:MAG: GIY-YIG nuclease family protein [Clostridia bacterium]|nr:GIY-YIG nuclease family protein [Clostridia bacterium]
MNKKHYAYMVRCADNTIYSGYAVNPYKRLEVHNSGKGAKYTRARLPVELIYYEEFENKSDALKREISLKKLTRSQKEELARNFNFTTMKSNEIIL